MNDKYTMTAEAVSEGHPDKLADKISDTILDEYLSYDPKARVACECLLSGRLAVVAGEICSTYQLKKPLPDLVKQVYRDTGYNEESLGFNIEDLRIIEQIQKQSEEISTGIERSDGNLGAGDQGIMLGYATDETPEFMPLPVILARKFMLKIANLRREGRITWLRPDAKCQVTVRYLEDVPLNIETIVLSTQHSPRLSNSEIRNTITDLLIKPILDDQNQADIPKILLNPAGSFNCGGPGTDTGITGRKIAVDGFGPFCPVGGGAFSGKDPTKVDRSGAYMARYIAKNIVAAKLASKCTVQICYAIGMAQPVSFSIDLHSTGKVDRLFLQQVILQICDLTPKGIIDLLELNRPIYSKISTCGHFGIDGKNYKWEGLELANELRSIFCMDNNSS